MGLQLIGQGGELLQVDAKHRASRVSLRPHDVGTLGGYRLVAISGAIAASLAAGAALFSFRWGDATRKCVLDDIQIGVFVDATITTAVPFLFDAVFLRTFTASDTGGTSIALTGNQAKVQTDMGTSLVTDMRIATTAALAAGTATPDGVGFAAAVGASGTTVGVQTGISLTSLYRPIAGVEHPISFAQNEGFRIRNQFGGPATGTFHIVVMVSWSEMASFNNAAL